MKKIVTLVLAALLLMTCFAGCAKSNKDSDLAYIQKKGTLIVGVTDYAPMDYRDETGSWTGFDAEFALAVAKELGVKVEFIEIDWDNKYFELESKSIDCIWNGMTICDEVNLNTSCSNPYVKNAQVVVMAADKAPAYQAVETLSELSFAAEAGSAGEAALKDLELTCTAVKDQATALMEVASGTADACVIDITMANAMTGEGTSYASLAIATDLTSEEYGIGFRKESDVTAKVNDIMAKMMTDGTLDALAEKYELALVK